MSTTAGMMKLNLHTAFYSSFASFTQASRRTTATVPYLSTGRKCHASERVIGQPTQRSAENPKIQHAIRSFHPTACELFLTSHATLLPSSANGSKAFRSLDHSPAITKQAFSVNAQQQRPTLRLMLHFANVTNQQGYC